MLYQIKNKVARFLCDENGPTAVEYAVMLAVILVGCIAAILSTGNVQDAMFTDTVSDMNDKMFK
jgi:pilus assembly protein Flp/PilA